MVGGFEADPLPIDAAAIPGYHMDAVPFDAEIADSFAAAMAPDIEVLRDATAQEERAGIFTMTADGKILAGPAAGVRGFWITTGCNGSGFSLACGVGRCIARMGPRRQFPNRPESARSQSLRRGRALRRRPARRRQESIFQLLHAIISGINNDEKRGGGGFRSCPLYRARSLVFAEGSLCGEATFSSSFRAVSRNLSSWRSMNGVHLRALTKVASRQEISPHWSK